MEFATEMSSPKKKYRVQGISFPDEELYLAALAKAKNDGRSLSNYICRLLEADIRTNTVYPKLDRVDFLLNEGSPASSSNKVRLAGDQIAIQAAQALRDRQKPAS